MKAGATTTLADDDVFADDSIVGVHIDPIEPDVTRPDDPVTHDSDAIKAAIDRKGTCSEDGEALARLAQRGVRSGYPHRIGKQGSRVDDRRAGAVGGDHRDRLVQIDQTGTAAASGLLAAIRSVAVAIDVAVETR